MWLVVNIGIWGKAEGAVIEHDGDSALEGGANEAMISGILRATMNMAKGRKFEQGWRQAPRKKTKGTRKSDQPTPATTLSTEEPISKQPVEVHVHNSTPQQASQQALSQWGYQAGYALTPPTYRYAPPYFPGHSSCQPYGTWAPDQGASQGYFAANSRRMTSATGAQVPPPPSSPIPAEKAGSEQIMEDFEAFLLYDEVIPDRRKQFKKVVAYLRRETFTLNEFRDMNREDLSEMAGLGIAKAIVQLSHKMVRQFKAQLSQQERQDHIKVKESAEALTMLGQQNGGGISEEYDYHQTCWTRR
ncbi:MAG: hypothetical protein MMC33_010382 [Icmadophila ericetorum]|nr:hypothetical protein [Icmadophila ericetorum]